MLEEVNEEIRRREKLVRIFLNELGYYIAIAGFLIIVIGILERKLKEE